MPSIKNNNNKKVYSLFKSCWKLVLFMFMDGIGKAQDVIQFYRKPLVWRTVLLIVMLAEDISLNYLEHFIFLIYKPEYCIPCLQLHIWGAPVEGTAGVALWRRFRHLAGVPLTKHCVQWNRWFLCCTQYLLKTQSFPSCKVVGEILEQGSYQEKFLWKTRL